MIFNEKIILKLNNENYIVNVWFKVLKLGSKK